MLLNGKAFDGRHLNQGEDSDVTKTRRRRLLLKILLVTVLPVVLTIWTILHWHCIVCLPGFYKTRGMLNQCICCPWGACCD